MKMIISRIQKEPDRTLLYGKDPHFHVIASRGTDFRIGDEIEYEAGGVNFRWYVKTISTENMRTLRDEINSSPLILNPPTFDEINKNQYIVIYGNIIDGFNFIGPFNSHENAETYTRKNNILDWRIKQLTNQEMI